MNEQKALAFGLAAVALWSTVATAFKLSLLFLEPSELLAWATLTSVVVLASILGRRGQLLATLRSPPAAYRRSALMALLNPALYYLILFEAYDRLPAQEAQALNYTWAIALALLSVPILGQRLSLADGAGTAVAYLGVLFIATHGDLLSLHFAEPLGVAAALASTLVWAIYWLLSAKDPRPAVASLFLTFLLALPLVAGAMVLQDGLRLPPLRGLVGAVYVGTFEMGLTFVLWLTALKLTTRASRIGNLIFLSPILSLGLIHGVLGERILPSTLVGLSLILSGLALQRLRPAA